MILRHLKIVPFFVLLILFCPIFYNLAHLSIKAQTVPIINSILPTSTIAGSPKFTMTINGNGFNSGSKIYFGNAEKNISLVSENKLTFVVDEYDVIDPGYYSVYISGSNGEKSEIKTFVVNSPTPIIEKLNPSLNVANSNGFFLNINGFNFVSGSIVYLNNRPKQTTYVSPEQITAYIYPEDVITNGFYNVNVKNPSPGEKFSNTHILTINNPLPGIKNISPSSIDAGSNNITLIINGFNFLPPFSTLNKEGSVVYLNNTKLNTVYNSESQLTAYIPSSLLVNAISYSVRVFNSSPGGGFSNSHSLQIENPIPVINSISTTSIDIGNVGFDLNIIGSKFQKGLVVNFNGSPRSTTYISSNRVVARILTSDLLKAGSYNITVANPAPGGGTSNTKIITVKNLVPTINNISPNSSMLNGKAFNITVNGSNFVTDSVVNFDGYPRKTSYISKTKLAAEILSSDISSPGLYNITVTNPAPGESNSNSLIFSVNNPLPEIESISQNSILSGGPDFLLTIHGKNFTKDTTINFDQKSATASYYGLIDQNNQLTFLISSSYIKDPGQYYITATNPAPGGGISNRQLFTVLKSSEVYTYSSCYFKQCRLFSSPFPISNSCQSDESCRF